MPIMPLGLFEIAEVLDTPRNTVDQWRRRAVLPDPDGCVGGRPAWWPETIGEWAIKTGRIKPATLVGPPNGRWTVDRDFADRADEFESFLCGLMCLLHGWGHDDVERYQEMEWVPRFLLRKVDSHG